MGWLVFFLMLLGIGIIVLGAFCGQYWTPIDYTENAIQILCDLGIIILYILGGLLFLQGPLYFCGWIYWSFNHWFWEELDLGYWEVIQEGLIGFIPVTFVAILLIGALLPPKR